MKIFNKLVMVNIKSFFKRLIRISVRNEFIWKILNITILKIANILQAEKKSITNKNSGYIDRRIFIEKLFPDLTVKHGIFMGMKYPDYKSIGSTLSPKLIGSYEKELADIMEEICKQQYSEIIIIGCAEGYYAVGLAMKIKSANVYAYDINKEAINYCIQMAKINSVSNRVHVSDHFDQEEFKNIKITKRGFILCDCEGCEKDIFVNDVIPYLSKCDLLIETHDFIDLTISGYLTKLFKKTHSLKVISSIDDIKKAQTYNYKELEGYSLDERKKILGEFRPSIMEWLYFKSIL